MLKKFSIAASILSLVFLSKCLYPQVPELKDADSIRISDTRLSLNGLNNSYEKLLINSGNKRLFSFPDELNKKRLATVVSVDGLLFASSVYALNEMWYKKYDRSAFHTFNDSRDWMQMDKLGHFKAAHIITAYGYYSFRWAGIEKTEAALYGGAVGVGYLTALEVLDGYSEHWGFSLADMTANVLGSAVFVSQAIFLEDRRIKFKISYHPTTYAKYRPEMFGDNFAERAMKDYNGQTHWLSVSSGLLFPRQQKIPKWLCFSVGYGAEGMLGGTANPEFNENGEALPTFDRYRQFYLSLDVDLAQVKTKKKWVRTLLLAVNAIKIPFPTLEYNTKGEFKFHYLYF